MAQTFFINRDICHVGFWNKGEGNEAHYPVLDRLIRFMKGRGFTIEHDPGVDRIIRKDFWRGRKGDLEFKAQRYPAGFTIEFFQNVVFENQHGGKYDFDKLQKMPYLVRLTFINECEHIRDFLKSLGIEDTSDPILKTAADKIKLAYASEWHHPQTSMDFQLEEVHGQTSESYNSHDKNGKTIYNGEVKYWRSDYTGRLQRGIVYHNINNMWWVIVNKHERRNIACFELFDATAEDFGKRRIMKARIPEKYRVRKEKLSESSAKELRNELKRRGQKVCAAR